MKPSRPPRSGNQQRGVIMVIALVALVLLLIGAAAMIRSMNASQSAAGSYGFKRDMANQGVRALDYVRNTLLATGGALSSATVRQASLPAENYSATMLPTSPEGIPTALLSTDSDFVASGVGTLNRDINVPDMQITVRYVIDRLCSNVGVPSADTCMVASALPPAGGTPGKPRANPPPAQPVYRLTVRVTGPRKAQSFFQSTFTV